MGVFFRSYNGNVQTTDIYGKEHADGSKEKDSLLNTRDSSTSNLGGSGIGAALGAGGIERSALGSSVSSSGNYTILLKLLNSWLRDIRHLDSLNPEIMEGSIDHKIMLCARWLICLLFLLAHISLVQVFSSHSFTHRTTAKIFMKIIVLIRPCCFNYLRVLGCQHNFESILHRVQNDWMHPALLVNKEELLVALHLAYDNA